MPHVVGVLPDALRAGNGESPGQRSMRWADMTSQVLEPWYRSTVGSDGLRLAEIENDRAGVPYTPGDRPFRADQGAAAGISGHTSQDVG